MKMKYKNADLVFPRWWPLTGPGVLCASMAGPVAPLWGRSVTLICWLRLWNVRLSNGQAEQPAPSLQNRKMSTRNQVTSLKSKSQINLYKIYLFTD
jgi:hypothetical protein